MRERPPHFFTIGMNFDPKSFFSVDLSKDYDPFKGSGGERTDLYSEGFVMAYALSRFRPFACAACGGTGFEVVYEDSPEDGYRNLFVLSCCMKCYSAPMIKTMEAIRIIFGNVDDRGDLVGDLKAIRNTGANIQSICTLDINEYARILTAFMVVEDQLISNKVYGDTKKISSVQLKLINTDEFSRLASSMVKSNAAMRII